MFGRRILAVLVAAVTAQSVTITNPSPSSWWVADSVNTLAWTCDTSSYSAYTVVLSNSDTSILSAPLALISNVPNYDCSYSVNAQQSSLAVSSSWTISLTDIQNMTNVYASSQFEIKAEGSTYPTSSSPAASSGTATSTSGSSSSTSTSSSKSGAAANYIPVGMSMAAAIVLGLVVA